MIFFLNASSRRNNFGIHTIGLSRFNLPLSSPNFANNSHGKAQKKIHVSLYIDIYSTTPPLKIMDSCFLEPQTHEYSYLTTF